jgi:hypothetical protein
MVSELVFDVGGRFAVLDQEAYKRMTETVNASVSQTGLFQNPAASTLLCESSSTSMTRKQGMQRSTSLSCIGQLAHHFINDLVDVAACDALAHQRV